METWANRKWLILGRSEMIGLLKPHEYNACAEQAYRMHGEGLYDKDLKGHIVLDRPPRQREAMPPDIEEPETGLPLAIVDGSYHNVMRTGAAPAVSRAVGMSEREHL